MTSNVKKSKTLKELVELIEKSNSIVMVSIKNLPTSQFQSIKKKLREHALVRVMKKTMIERAIDESKKGAVKNFKKFLKEDIALIFSDLNPFEISAILSKNKSMSRAKAGQILEEDVIVEPGPTELVPGPIISELGALGLKFMIEDGKITIRDKKVIVKVGDKVSEQAASIMSKLDMKPAKVGLEPIAAYDAREDTIYENIKIDPEKTLEEIKQASSKSLAFAVKFAYACKDTIKFLIAKASNYERALDKLIKTDIQGG